MRQKNKTLVNISVFCLSLIFLFLGLEILARTYHFFSEGIPFFSSIAYISDSELGWRGKEIFGDPSTNKYKIFFVGDSFTAGAGVRERYLYYAIIGNKLDAELFVYGGGAQGTMQEYIALDKYLDAINPDLVVLQVCDNDFINNSWELESASFIFNDFRIRPYLIDEKVEYRFPRAHWKWIIFLSHSRFLRIVLNRMERLYRILAIKGLLHSVEMDIQANGIEFEAFKKAVTVTDELIAKFKNRIGNTPLIAFSVDDNLPYFNQFREIFKKNGIEFIEEVAKTIKAKEAAGLNLHLADGHFNEMGNKICADVLIETIRRFKYVSN